LNTQNNEMTHDATGAVFHGTMLSALCVISYWLIAHSTVQTAPLGIIGLGRVGQAFADLLITWGGRSRTRVRYQKGMPVAQQSQGLARCLARRLLRIQAGIHGPCGVKSKSIR